MTNRHKILLLSAVTGAVLLLVPVNAWAQRGASGPPEHANVEPVNYRPNPYLGQIVGCEMHNRGGPSAK